MATGRIPTATPPAEALLEPEAEEPIAGAAVLRGPIAEVVTEAADLLAPRLVPTAAAVDPAAAQPIGDSSKLPQDFHDERSVRAPLSAPDRGGPPRKKRRRRQTGVPSLATYGFRPATT